MFLNQRCTRRSPTRLILVMMVALVLPGQTSFGASWQRILRSATKVADDVPLKQADEVAERLGKSKAVRESLEQELRRSGDLVGAADDAARATAIARRLEKATTKLDPGLIKQLDELATSEKGVALLLVQGGDRIAITVPDLAARGRFLQDCGTETVAAIGLLGDDAAEAALKLNTAIRTGTIISPAGLRPVTVADFGKLMVERGDSAWNFWKTKVQPHWKLWVGGGALAAFLIDPDGFIDKAGELTEAGIKRLTELIGEVAARTIQGVANGSGAAVEKVRDSIWRAYMADARKGLAALVGTLLFLAIVLPRSRLWLWSIVRKLILPKRDTTRSRE